MHVRNFLLGALIALGSSMLPIGQAQALPAGWTGGCVGSDYFASDGNGNYIIFHDSWRCA